MQLRPLIVFWRKLRFIFSNWQRLEDLGKPWPKPGYLGNDYKILIYGTCEKCQCLQITPHISEHDGRHFLEYYCARYQTHVDCKQRLDICIEDGNYMF